VRKSETKPPPQFEYEFAKTGLTELADVPFTQRREGWVQCPPGDVEYYDGVEQASALGGPDCGSRSRTSGASWAPTSSRVIIAYYKRLIQKVFEHGLRYVVETEVTKDLLPIHSSPTTVSNMVHPAVLQVLLRIRYRGGD